MDLPPLEELWWALWRSGLLRGLWRSGRLRGLWRSGRLRGLWRSGGAWGGSGELDGTSRGSGELDGTSRGSRELDGTSRGSGGSDTRGCSGHATSWGHSGSANSLGRSGSAELGGTSGNKGELDGTSGDIGRSLRGAGTGGHLRGAGTGGHLRGAGTGGHMRGAGTGGHMRGAGSGDHVISSYSTRTPKGTCLWRVWGSRGWQNHHRRLGRRDYHRRELRHHHRRGRRRFRLRRRWRLAWKTGKWFQRWPDRCKWWVQYFRPQVSAIGDLLPGSWVHRLRRGWWHRPRRGQWLACGNLLHSKRRTREVQHIVYVLRQGAWGSGRWRLEEQMITQTAPEDHLQCIVIPVYLMGEMKELFHIRLDGAAILVIVRSLSGCEEMLSIFCSWSDLL